MPALLDRFAKREFRLILAGFLMLVLVGSLSYCVLPQLKQLSAAREKIAALATLPLAGDSSIQLEAMREMVGGLELSLRGEAGSMPARELEAYLIGKLQSISWAQTVELDSVKPGQRKRVRGFWETSFQVDISGRYESLYDWMSETSEQLGFIVIKEFRLMPVRGDTDEPVLKASMTIATYQSK